MIFAIPPHACLPKGRRRHGRWGPAVIGFGHVQTTTRLINAPLSQPSICFHLSLPNPEP
jgi:hypothetical protein